MGGWSFANDTCPTLTLARTSYLPRSVSMIGVAVKLTACQGVVARRAPLLGEHTATVTACDVSTASGVHAGAGSGAGAGAGVQPAKAAPADKARAEPTSDDAAATAHSPFRVRVASGGEAAIDAEPDAPFLSGVRVLDLSSCECTNFLQAHAWTRQLTSGVIRCYRHRRASWAPPSWCTGSRHYQSRVTGR